MKVLFTMLLLAPIVALAEENAAPSPASPAESGVDAGIAPSRMVGPSLSDHVADLRDKLAINGRKRGPFGLHQDLSKASDSLLTISKKTVVRKETPFELVVNAINIAAVFPREQEFLVGSRSFRKGQTFPLVAGQDKISVRVEGVHSNRVSFRNLRSGEVIDKRLDLLPDGVTNGVGSIVPAGVTPGEAEEGATLHVILEGGPAAPR